MADWPRANVDAASSRVLSDLRASARRPSYRDNAPGGVSIFGKQFGNHDQDIVMRIHVK
jgi:predicted transcriptional regulator